MRLSNVVLPLIALIVLIKWTMGIEPENLDNLQLAIELMLVCMVLLEIIPRFIKKLNPRDARKFIGVLPTLALLLVLSWKFPGIDPALLEVLAIILVILNLLTLSVVKKKLAKRLARKKDNCQNPEIGN